MDRLGHFMAGKIGDLVEDAVKGALGIEDKDKDKDEKKGGIFSLFGGDKKKDDDDEDKDKDKGGLFSFGGKKEEDKEDIFSKIFNRDDDDDDHGGQDKKTGFAGLWTEQEGGPGGAGGGPGGARGGPGGAGGGPGAVGGGGGTVSDRDLYSDLLDVANETSKGD